MNTETLLNRGGYAVLVWMGIAQAYIQYRFVWPWIAHCLAPHSFTIYSLSGHLMHWN
jgi:hypothetical protein